MSFVLDASMALAWCFEDEATAETDRILRALKQSEAVVPQLWCIEVANALLVGQRRQRIDGARADRFTSTLLALPIAVDPGSRAGPFQDARRLAEAHRLTVYDASYLELALRMKLPLATLDAPLRQAAEREGVALFQPG